MQLTGRARFGTGAISKSDAVPEIGAEREVLASHESVPVLRLKPDRQARLRQGELGNAKAESIGRFVTIAGLGLAIQRWLDQQPRSPEKE
jgi:hypothetical protein